MREFIFILATIIFTAPCFATDNSSNHTKVAKSTPQHKKASRPQISRSDIEKFCLHPEVINSNPPDKGIQYDGKKADPKVMALKVGRYYLPDNAVILLFDTGRFLVRVNDHRNHKVFGTDGPDLMLAGGLVGGCYPEQLSEVVVKNNLDISILPE